MRILLTILLSIPMLTFAQRPTNASKSELGIIGGGMYYIGDLNRYYHFNNTHLSGGLLYRYEIHGRMTFRANFMYGKVSASDAENKEASLQDRNLNFESSIYEGAAGIEFNYVSFLTGKRSRMSLNQGRGRVTAYLLAQIGMFRMNPKTEYNGGLYELQPLGTEGQGTSLSKRKHYSLIQPCVPLGVGLRFKMGNFGSANIEFSARKTFTDYLDDVHSNSYADYAIINSENGPLAATLSNRSLSQSRYAQRGNKSTKDWYFFAGISLSFKLGSEKVCAQPK